jgi:4'-phosphopantetheinyl transferase
MPEAEDEIQVWTLSLELPEAEWQPLAALLSEDERARAVRFVFERHRRRFTAARAALRHILGARLGVAPAEVRFAYGPHGKPELAAGCGAGRLRFNLAHSHELALVALCEGRELGVDVEHVRPLADAMRIAERFFSTREREALAGLPPEAQREAFFRCWTRKEAYLKALGDGLARPLDGFDVSLARGEPAALLGVAADPAEAARWGLAHLEPAPGYVGALAVEGSGWSLRAITLPGAL